MSDDEEELDPATRRGRLRAARRTWKRRPGAMAVTGKSVFLIKRLIEAGAQKKGRRRRR